MPDYSLLDPQSDKGLLAWDWAGEQLASSRNYWIATVHPNSRLNMTPIWGIWLQDVCYLSVGHRSRKARNLAVSSNCAISTDNPVETVIHESRAQRVIDPALLQRVADIYIKKYDWPREQSADGVQARQGNGGPLFTVYPRVVFAINEDLAGSATRWTFKE